MIENLLNLFMFYIDYVFYIKIYIFFDLSYCILKQNIVKSKKNLNSIIISKNHPGQTVGCVFLCYLFEAMLARKCTLILFSDNKSSQTEP